METPTVHRSVIVSEVNELAKADKITPEELTRVQRISKRLQDALGLKVIKVKPIGAGHNSIMRLVTFSACRPTRQSKFVSTKPLTSPIPDGVTELIMRESNPEAELNPAIAVPNEVIAQYLARKSGIPAANVYDWSAEKDDGWMAIELLPGVNLKEHVDALDLTTTTGQATLEKILLEEAKMLKRVKEIELPATMGYGGFRFSATGTIESGEMSLPYGGPHYSLAGLYGEMIAKQLASADKCEPLKGWRPEGLRERLDRFVDEGLAKLLKSIKADKPVFIHGDFNMLNMLWDTEKQEITGVVDMEWAHTAGPADEWFYSFGWEVGVYGGPYDDDEDEVLLANSILHGFPSPLPDPGPKPEKRAPPGEKQWHDWKRAKMWDDSLASVGAPKPTSITGFEEAARVYWMAQEICQWWMLQQRIIDKMGPEKVSRMKDESRRRLEKYLDAWGY